jgi:hypothetical protein
MAVAALPTGRQAAPAVAPRKFRSGVQAHIEQIGSQTFTPGTSSQPFAFDVPAYGFLRGLYLMVDVIGGSGAAVYRGDAPASWIQTYQLLDVNSAPIHFQLSGFEGEMVAKYCGYFANGDYRTSPSYTQGGTGGNSSFILPIRCELRSRDCTGSLPNKNNAASYRLVGSIAPLADVFSTAPATAPTQLQLRVFMDAWWEPSSTDLKGRPQAQEPPAANTTQFISKQISGVMSGVNTMKLSRVGYLIRNLIFICRDNASPSVRSNTVFPQSSTLIYEGQNLTLIDRDLWRHKMAADYGFTAAPDGPNGLDTGVFVLPFTQDFGLTPGAEMSAGYLPTTTASRLELQGSFTAPGSLSVLTNDVSARDELEISPG